jgi:hypothetical protein
MMVFPGMIAKAAEKAGMKVPADPDGKWKPKDFPHFHVFCNVQLARPIHWGEHWENAEIIAAIPEAELKTLTLANLISRGLRFVP